MVMIFLLLITMFSISAFRSSTSNLRVTQNMAVRQEATDAAQAAIETVISTPAFQTASAASAVPFSVPVDVDGDGTGDYNVTVTPAATCSKIRPMTNAELPRNANTGLPLSSWIRCDSGSTARAAGSGSAGSGLIEGGSTTATVSGMSYCVETLWDVQANVSDASSGATVQVNQGVAVPYSVGESGDRCKRNN